MKFFFLAILVLFSVESFGLESSEVYTRQETPLNFGLDFTYSPVRFANPSQLGANQVAHVGRVSLEWMPLTSHGKLGISVSAGAGGAHMNRLDNRDAAFTVLMGELSAAYRLDVVKDQVLVPFMKFGRSLGYVREEFMGDSVHHRSLPLFEGWQYGFGLEILLDLIESRSSALLDQQFGVNNVYLELEYVSTQQIQSIGPNLSSDSLRVGLRFEI